MIWGLRSRVNENCRRVRDQESRSVKREEGQRERLEKLETMVYSQHKKLDRLEDLVYRVMHRDRVSFDTNSESPKYEEDLPSAQSNKANETLQKPQTDVTAIYYPITSA